MTEMQSAIGLAELDRMDTWNMPRRRRNAQIILDALRDEPLVKFRPIDTPERQNGWYVMAFSLDIENMRCDIARVRQSRRRRGRALLEGLLAAVPHRTRLPRAQRLRPIRLPLHVEGIHRPGQRGLLARSRCPTRSGIRATPSPASPIPTYEPQHCEQIGAALRKVIRAYAK